MSGDHGSHHGEWSNGKLDICLPRKRFLNIFTGGGSLVAIEGP